MDSIVNPQPMLTTKMTGLDLGPGGQGGGGTNGGQATLTTPTRSHLHSPRTLKELKSKPWSPNMLMSPTSVTTPLPSTLTPSPRPPTKQSKKDGSGGSGDDVLTTPVITVPKCGDAWNSFRPGSKSPPPLGVSPGLPTSDDVFPPPDKDGMEIDLPREPPKDLPMDSDIGLKSPHDGLLAKRRTFAKMKKTPSVTSENSAYSCDTPTTPQCESNNSPTHTAAATTPAAPPTGEGAGQPPQPAQKDASHRLAQPPVSGVSKSPTTLKAKIQAEFSSSFNCTAPSAPLIKSRTAENHDPAPSAPAPHSHGSVGPAGAGSDLTLGKKEEEPNFFKHPNNNTKPENLKLTGPGGGGGGADLPSCYAQSPLKSPNWIAISQNFGGDMWKTPKILDNTVFDFLPPPNTPRGTTGAKVGSPRFRDHSPGNSDPADLSRLAQLSPRFLIPEAPTDLSNNSSSHRSDGSGGSSSSGSMGPGSNSNFGMEEKAQDLSMTSRLAQEEPMVTSSPTPPPPVPQVVTTAATSIAIKQEAVAVPTVSVSQYQSPPTTEYNSHACHPDGRSNSPSGYPGGHPSQRGVTMLNPDVKIKSEATPMDEFNHANGQNQPPHFYAAAVRQQQQAHQQAQAQAQAAVVANAMAHGLAPSAANLYLQSIYINRQMYNNGGSTSPPSAATPPNNHRGPSPSLSTGSGGSHLSHFGNNLIARPQHSVSPYNNGTWSSNSSPGPAHGMPLGGGGSDHQWPHQRGHEDGEASITPPPHPFGHMRKSSPEIPILPPYNVPQQQDPALGAAKKRGRKPGSGDLPDLEAKKPGNASGRKGKKGAKQVEGGTKRVYSCPHCQRSYDWNYNLNRHLKYECGKENAFQCSKCGRRFPHKQNCVYHLKRKHKIVCENIDQYVSAGLVVFHGNAGSQGNGSKQDVPVSDG